MSGRVQIHILAPGVGCRQGEGPGSILQQVECMGVAWALCILKLQTHETIQRLSFGRDLSTILRADLRPRGLTFGRQYKVRIPNLPACSIARPKSIAPPLLNHIFHFPLPSQFPEETSFITTTWMTANEIPTTCCACFSCKAVSLQSRSMVPVVTDFETTGHSYMLVCNYRSTECWGRRVTAWMTLWANLNSAAGSYVVCDSQVHDVTPGSSVQSFNTSQHMFQWTGPVGSSFRCWLATFTNSKWTYPYTFCSWYPTKCISPKCALHQLKYVSPKILTHLHASPLYHSHD